MIHELRGVGANLQDHYVARVSHRVKGSISINKLARGVRLMREALRFAIEGRGALTFGVTTAQVFCRSTPEKASPDLQLLFTPASYDAAKFGELEREDGMTVAVCPVRPDSRGTIMARSADPAEKPVITPNYLSDPADIRVLSAGIRFTRTIFAAPAIAAHSVAKHCPARMSRPTTRSWIMLGVTAPRSTTRSAPAAWATDRLRWWTCGCECMG